MERATLTRPGPETNLLARLHAVSASTWAKIGFGAMCVGAIVLFAVYPMVAAYDSMYALIWGRELIHGSIPDVDAYRVPTQHPLWILVGAVVAIFGEAGDRILVAVTLAAFVAMVAGAYRLARVCFGPVIGWLAALVLVTRLDLLMLAMRGFLDIPYLALLVWAAALVAEKPRRGLLPWVLLFLAGLLRPEAWLLAIAYAVFLGWKAGWGERVKYGLFAIAAPIVWMLSDVIFSGDPLASNTRTSENISSLSQGGTVREIPSTLVANLAGFDTHGVIIAGGIGALIAIALVPRRSVMPLILLATGIGTFVGIAVLGLGHVERYVAIAAVALCVFAGFSLGSWNVVRAGALQMGLAAGAVLLLGVIGYTTATKARIDRRDYELTTRPAAYDSLKDLLDNPAVQAGRRCGPISVPSHKLIPEVRWILDAPESDVIARTDPDSEQRARRGVAIFNTGGQRFLGFAHYGPWLIPGDEASNQVPGPGFVRVASGPYFAAYVNC
jgi:hypothetical protein